jgi:hypothetical protein
MSLSEISVVSALALPLYAYDIPNNERYNFGEIGLAVPVASIRHQPATNWPPPSNTQSTTNTTFSAIFAPWENIPAELQLATPSTTSAGRTRLHSTKSSGHDAMLSTPLPDYKHAANQSPRQGPLSRRRKPGKSREALQRSWGEVYSATNSPRFFAEFKNHDLYLRGGEGLGYREG